MRSLSCNFTVFQPAVCYINFRDNLCTALITLKERTLFLNIYFCLFQIDEGANRNRFQILKYFNKVFENSEKLTEFARRNLLDKVLNYM